MNINAATSIPFKLAASARPGPEALPLKSEAANEAVAPPLTAKEKRARDFYTREEEPWKSATTEYNEGTEIIRRPMTKAEYLKYERSMAGLDIVIQQSQLDKFRHKLMDIRPDLAGKHISYTLGDDAQIKILDHDKVFSEEQLEWLTESLNKLPNFRDTVQDHAKRIMTLVDHDTETFGNQYSLNLMNFQHTVDYGKLISIKDRDELNDAWSNQIRQNGEKREAALVDVIA